ncbi:MAG TPA: L-tyrosine/L-tryptophan isonitrile synthase family protein, partial [Kineosporiaceae bacterium]
ERVHPPGVRVLVCSDGHVFADLIGVTDEDVDAYVDALRGMIRAEGLSRIGTFDLRDVFGDLSSSRKRELLDEGFAPAMEQLRAEVRSDEHTLALYRGITRFLVEDTVSFTGTRSALQKQCRERAYGVIQRSRAWGNLVAREHPQALRLSIHPQPRGATKFGIRLLDAPDTWTTPWHSVVLRHPDGRVELMPHHQARARGELVEVDGCPDHYRADPLAS